MLAVNIPDDRDRECTQVIDRDGLVPVSTPTLYVLCALAAGLAFAAVSEALYALR